MPDSQVFPAVSQLLSKSQVAERYQCSTRTVDRLRKDEAFPPPLKIGNLCRWPIQPILEWGSVEGSIGCVALQSQHHCVIY